MNMQTVRGSPEPPSRPRSRNLGLAFLLTSESQPDVMDSKPQSLCSSFSITAANGRKDSKPPSSSPEIGDARPKPPVKPKPCVLPKPAIPVKPVPGQRQTLSEVPSAEKINLLAGPKPYSSGAGNAVKRLSFNLKCSSREVTNGKEVPSSFSTASKSSEDKEGAEPTKKSSAIEKTSEEECRESSSIVRCTLPFKVKPVPVATKPERFPGTTVEEILAKIEKPSESSPSFDRPRLVRSFFSQDGGSTVHLGPKGYVAFRKSFSGEEGVGTNPEGSAYQVSCEIKERSLSRNKELKEEDRNSKVSESQQPETEVKRNEIFLPADSSSSQPSRSCKGDQLESSSPPSSPGTKFSSRVTPGSPDAPSETTQPPGAPYLPTDVPCSEALLPPGSPDGSDKSSRSPLVDSEHDDDNLLEAELGGEIPPLQGSYQEAGSEGQIGKEEVTEASEPSGNKESERNWKKIEGQLETESTLELSAPGGPSVQRKIGSPNLKDPVVAEEVTLQEDHDDFLQFPPNHEEEALRAMEPLPSVEQSAPPAEPCILFSEGVQVQTADTCQEECDALGMAQEAKMGNSDLLGGVEPNPNSHWLDELLASPPPSADDTKRNTPQVEDPTGPQDLLGWSRKDLHSEFGIVGADHSNTFGLGWTADVTKVKWLGETEQDREFGTGLQDWPNSYTVGNAKGQDMEFGTSQQEWAGGSASPGQEEWLASYGSHCADHPTEESDWSSTYSISAAEGQDAEPYVRKPGWPKLCSAGSDQQSSEFVAVEKTDWNSQYHDDDAETTAWPKYMENISCPESDVSPESAKLPSECTIESQLETELSVKHSDDSTPVSVFSASHLVWPSESDSGSGTSQLQREFSAHQVEQSSEPQNNPESQLSFQQDSRPDTYGFDDGSYPESKLNVKQSDWPSRCETGIAQNQDDEFSADKPDEVKEYDGEIGCSIEKDNGIKGSNSQMEVDNQQFYAQRPIWSDEYSLNKFEPQEDCFAPGRGDWIKDSNFSETEQNDTTRQDLIPGFGSLGLSDQKVTVNLEESVDNLIHQAGNLMNLSMDEPRGIGEGESECIQHLDIGDLAISSDLKVESLEAYKKPVEKQLDWDLPFGMETSSATSNTRSVNAGGREPDVGQADLINDMDVSDTKKADVSDLRPKALDGTEVVYRDESHHLEITGLEDDVMQHQGATPVSGESRKCHSQRLSSPSCLLEGMVSRSANRPEAQQKRPASFHSCHSEEKRKLNNLPSELVPAADKIRPSPFPLEDVGEVLSDTDGGISQPNSGNWRQHPEEQSESEATQPISQDDLEGAEALTRENFTFLEDTDVLDNSAHRDRANLGRKRGHRAPITRAGGTVLENDRNSWMFRDSTEPQLVSAVSDEEVHEETKSKKSRSSPLSKGVKVALFPGLSPSALKAKLRGRNRSAEEGEPQGEAKEAAVQRSKSCKMGSASGKPLVLPPKPEKSSGLSCSGSIWNVTMKCTEQPGKKVVFRNLD
ncbi:182 kDa tankyrase-1-binding protein isoform X7 [Crotalus tigris]|uniref:182 kDa tankyrase-1-binding protein isoform X7 n=1 Tax=Crotalus tigris TaxID=88082 RepID=UPI00192F43A5|nr:182 kDa tankyrase-1-binding protein isoform X7 [Crotalus tigris]